MANVGALVGLDQRLVLLGNALNVTFHASLLFSTGTPASIAMICVPGSSTPTSSTSVRSTSSTSTTPTSSTQTGTFSNPVLWEDAPDIDIIRVNNTYYYSASSFHLSPGAPILRSYDLVNWEFAGHSVPVLDWSSNYDLTNGNRAYVKGIWASFFGYRKSNGLFYWGGCIEFGKSYVYTAPAVGGPWTKRSTINNCWYDAGLLIDDDDTMYVAYGNTNIYVAQLSADGLSQVKTQQVFSSSFTIEGSRFYKRNGIYYIFVTRPADGQFILKSTSGPWGPYTIKAVLDKVPSPTTVNGGVPHQGGLVETQNGDWYYMAFIDAYPGGRIPALAPITWDSSGWPVLQLVNGVWGSTYPKPNLPAPPATVKSPTGTDTFTSLNHEWEWNHNPDNSKWSLSSGLRLSTASVVTDLYQARNTLTHRILGPVSTATIILDYSSMANGDRAGLALFRDSSAWIGVAKDSGACRVAVVSGITLTDAPMSRHFIEAPTCRPSFEPNGDTSVELSSRDDCFLTNVSHLILELSFNGQILYQINLSSREWNPKVWDADQILILPQASAEFMISVSMEVDGNESQLLGFMELNGPALYDGLGKAYEIPLTSHENHPSLILKTRPSGINDIHQASIS
ncbi:Arabinanase/levansucrase/invertase [Serendipita vermifera]|nr:Arabinanase/levansucrase/invertase [Serendipita vermifera]